MLITQARLHNYAEVWGNWMLAQNFVYAYQVINTLYKNLLFVGLLTKDILGYWVNHRVCFRQRFYVWPTLVALLLAGAVHYALLRWAGGLLWREGPLGSILLLFFSLVPSLPLFAFFYAFFGGWDEETLEELRCAVELSGALRGPARLFWLGSAWGAHKPAPRAVPGGAARSGHRGSTGARRGAGQPALSRDPQNGP